MKKTLHEARWRLFALAADRGVRSASELADLLAERAGYTISAAHLTRFFKDTPPSVTMEFLTALLTTLQADISELIRVEVGEREVEIPREAMEKPELKQRRRRLRSPTSGKAARTKDSTEDPDKTGVSGPKLVTFPQPDEED